MKSIYQQLVEKHGLSPAQKIIISLVDSGKVLEIGSSSGYLTKEFVKKGCKVDVVEINKEDAKEAGKLATFTFVGSIEDENIQKILKEDYDFIICADVLEHLVDPEKVLGFFKRKLKKNGQILISIPNIAFWNSRIELLKGRFEYQQSGLFDKTHLRFYTYNSFLKLLQKIGFKIVAIFPAETKIPFEYSLKKIPLVGWILVRFIKPPIIKAFPNLTYYHYVIQAKI
ncbi:MAG: type 11 methyltransferase [Microgenomates group bacterium Gr01-1014_7]|nr:MAG: type 11 methyltransferase [Microgenomates group bacterium Gr01-1014_7]